MDPNPLLHQLLTAHGLDVRPVKGWLTADGRPAALTTSIYRNESWHPSLLQLDVRALVPDGRILIESFTGIGDDTEAAVRSGIEALCQSSLHVLLTTLWDVDPGDHVVVETWQTSVGERRAAIGPTVQRGGPVQVPDDVFPAIQAALEARATGPLHWLRVFRSGSGPSAMTEVLLDNQEWPALREELAALPWPRTEGYSSVRLFMTLYDPAQLRG